MPLPVKLFPATLPPGYCIDTLQAFVNLMFSQGFGEITTSSSIAKIIVSDTEPTADQRDYIWERTKDGVVEGSYAFKDGAWVRPHEIPAGGSSSTAGFRTIWTGAAADLPTYDGGDGSALGNASGPFWEIDTSFAAKMMLGVGALPSGTVVNVGDTGGEEKHTLTLPEIPPHTHGYDKYHTGAPYKDDPVDGTQNDGGNEHKQTDTAGGDGSGNTVAHNNMPPYIGVYVIKRTSRIYRKPL